jgi:hypothetical protein
VAPLTHDPRFPADCLGQPLNLTDERLGHGLTSSAGATRLKVDETDTLLRRRCSGNVAEGRS